MFAVVAAKQQGRVTCSTCCKYRLEKCGLFHLADLHKIGGLPTLLSLMSNPAPSIRWRAAEISATCMANNPPVQRWFMEGGALPPLVSMMNDANPTCQAKSLLAISALIRHFQPGLEAFRLAGGVYQLMQLLKSCAGQLEGTAAAGVAEGEQEQQRQQQVRTCRKALTLLSYVCQSHPADCEAVAGFGAAGVLLQLLQEADDGVREGALQLLVELGSHPAGWVHVRQQQPQLQQQLEELEAQQQGRGEEGREGYEEEEQLVGRLLGMVKAGEGPAGVKAGKSDHIEVDPYMDGGVGSKAVGLEAGQQQQQQQQEGAGGGVGGGALMVVPKQEMR